jgi:hypothetical protein
MKYFFLLCHIIILSAQAQEKSSDDERFYFRVDYEFVYHPNVALSFEIDNVSYRGYMEDGTLSESNLKISLGAINQMKKYSLGIGGVVNNGMLTPNISIFLEGVFYFSELENSPFVSLLVGGIIPFYENELWVADSRQPSSYYAIDGIQRGFNYQLGIGKKLKFFRKLSALLHLGYDFKGYSLDRGDSFFTSSERLSTGGYFVRLGLFIL